MGQNISFNMNFIEDKVTLKESPVDYDEMKKGVEQMISKLDNFSEKNLERAEVCFKIGIFSRLVDMLEESVQFLTESAEIMKNEGKESLYVASRLRLAVTLHWKNNFIESDKIFFNAIEKLSKKERDEKALRHLDFAYYHLAKSKFDRGFYQDAQKYFVKAMDLRIERGDISYIESVKHAICITQQKIENS